MSAERGAAVALLAPLAPEVPEVFDEQEGMPREMERMQAELDRARAEVEAAAAQARAAVAQGQAAAAAQGALAVQPGAAPGGAAPGAVTDGSGRVVVTTPDGKQVVFDSKLFDRDQLQAIVQQAVTQEPPPPPEFSDGPPKEVIALVAIVMFFLTLMAIGIPLARAGARRMDRKQAGGGREAGVSPDVTARLERIEQSVDGVAIELERVAEAQRFSARLLSERLPEALPLLDAAARREGVQALPGRGREG